MAEFEFSSRALRELDEILDYIRDRSGEARAEVVSKRIFSTLTTIANAPGMGVERQHPSPEVRRFSVSPWLVYYRPDTARRRIRVLRIIDGRRNLSDIL